MGKIKWYKRDPDAALTGMMMLSLEERGAYNTVLDLIYTRDGALPDDDRFLAGWMRCDVRVWKRIKMALIQAGKIAVIDGFLTNLRATYEIDAALGRVASAREAGRISASKSRDRLSEIKEMVSTIVERDPQPYTTTTTARKKGEGKPSPKAESSILPEWMDSVLWDAFREMRKGKKDPMTAHAEKLMIGRLERFRQQGHDPTAMIEQSIRNGWKDVYEIKGDRNENFGRNFDAGNGIAARQGGVGKSAWTSAAEQIIAEDAASGRWKGGE